MPQARYNAAYNANFPNDAFVRIYDNAKTFQTLTGTTLTLPLEPKAIQDEMGEAYDKEYGRMSGKLGLELPFTNAGRQTFVLQGFIDPPTEIIKDSGTVMAPIAGDGTQIWKITHNGVDTHPIHFHLFDVQVINRVGWDGAIRPPDDNELGWKDTLRVSPLEDTIVALRPVKPTLPWPLPDSVRLFDPTMPEGSSMGFGNINPLTGEPITITNQLYNFGWEYTWHCHILGHEEMDMMRPLVFQVAPEVPSMLPPTVVDKTVTLAWVDNSKNAVGFTIQRASDSAFTQGLMTFSASAGQTSYTDTVETTSPHYYRIQAINAFEQTSGWSNTVSIFAPTVVLTPASVNFGDQTLNISSVAQSLTVTNAVSRDVVINSVTIAGVNAADYTQTNNCATLSVGANCTINVTFTPSAIGNRVGTVSVIHSEIGSPLTALLTGNGIPPIVPPVANNDSATTNAGTAVNINVLANDTPAANIDATTVIIVTQPANGTAVANTNGTVTYTPNAGFSGTNTFTYNVKDNVGTVSNNATVTVTVSAPVGDFLGLSNGQTVSGIIFVRPNSTLHPDIRKVFYYLDGTQAGKYYTAPFTWGGASGFDTRTIGNGPHTLGGIYTTATGDHGFSINFIVNNGTVPVPPAAANDTASAITGTATVINVLANDSATAPAALDPTTVTVVTQPANGTAAANANGTVTYTSNAGFSGTNTFTYNVKDNAGTVSNNATVTVTVSLVIVLPVANNDTATTTAGTAVNVNVIANDTPSAAIDSATVIIVTQPLHGTTTVNTNGTVTYTPSAGYSSGTDTFTYNVKNKSGDISNNATVTITISAAVGDFIGLSNGQTVSGTVFVRPNLTLHPSIRKVFYYLDGTISDRQYSSPFQWKGTAGFDTRTISDGPHTLSGAYTDATGDHGFSITFSVSNTTPLAPVAGNDTASTSIGTAITINVLANDTASAPRTINAASVVVVTQPANGVAVANENGTITYTPTAGFSGTNAFTYTVLDSANALSNTATVTVTVNTAGGDFIGLTNGQTVSGIIFVQPNLTLHPDVRKVFYYLNETQAGKYYAAPFTWGGANGYDTRTLPNGAYTLSGIYTTAAGNQPFSIEFNVSN